MRCILLIFNLHFVSLSHSSQKSGVVEGHVQRSENVQKFKDSDQELLDRVSDKYSQLSEDNEGPYHIKSFNVKAGYLVPAVIVVRFNSVSFHAILNPQQKCSPTGRY